MKLPKPERTRDKVHRKGVQVANFLSNKSEQIGGVLFTRTRCHLCRVKAEQTTFKWVKMADGCAHPLCRRCAKLYG